MSGKRERRADHQGRIVRYVISGSGTTAVTRPMMIVQAWNENVVNGVVFRDGPNDNEELGTPLHGSGCTQHASSVHHDAARRLCTWHWPGEPLPVAKDLEPEPNPEPTQTQADQPAVETAAAAHG